MSSVNPVGTDLDRFSPGGAEPVTPLQDRMVDSRGKEGVADAEFETFYKEFVSWVNGPPIPTKNEVLAYLSKYQNADGDKPYNFIQQKMDALTKILEGMKEDGFDVEGDAYKAVRESFVGVFAMKPFFDQFMQDVFKTPDDEESSW